MMRSHCPRRRQEGATLVVGVIMLVLITLVVTTALTMSTANSRSVGNMQFRDQAIAAANKAIEQVLGSPFTNAPAAEQINVDIDNDASTDFVVNIGTPQCVRAAQASAPLVSSLSLGGSMSTSSTWNTIWDITASVSDGASGTAVVIRQGVRVLLSQAQKDAVCP